MLTEAEIEELKKLLNHVTPGPWVKEPNFVNSVNKHVPEVGSAANKRMV